MIFLQEEMAAMKPSEAFDRTLEEFGLKAKTLAARAKVHESQVNRFRHAKAGISYQTVQDLIDAMPREAAQYYYRQLLASRDLISL